MGVDKSHLAQQTGNSHMDRSPASLSRLSENSLGPKRLLTICYWSKGVMDYVARSLTHVSTCWHLCSRSVLGTDNARVNKMDIVSALRDSKPSTCLTTVRSYESIGQGTTHDLRDGVGLEGI